MMDKLALRLILKRYISSMSDALEKKLTEYVPHDDKREEYKQFSKTFVKEFKKELDRTLVKPAMKNRS